MEVSVVIPYRESGDERKRNFDYVCNYWKTFFPRYEVVVCDSGDDNFSRSKSRNQGIDLSHGDYLIIADADTVVPPEAIVLSLDLVEDGVPWLIAYEWYYNLTASKTEDFVLDKRPSTSHPVEGEYDHKLESWAGMLVIPREAFSLVKYDERFSGWGYEDNAFQVEMDTLWGKHERTPYPAFHLWHPAPNEQTFGNPDIISNRKLFQRYERAKGRPNEMLHIRQS
jgi:predicted glycosyltransferase involved in capsule biosynthesis